MFQRGSGCSRSETPGGQAPFERGERQGRWKESPEVPVSCFFGDKKAKGERGMKKAGASSKIQRKKARKVQKPTRVRAPLQFER
jgi:hypothetical protein